MRTGFDALKSGYGPSTPLVTPQREEKPKWCGVDRCRVVALIGFVAITASMLTATFLLLRDDKHQGDHTT